MEYRARLGDQWERKLRDLEWTGTYRNWREGFGILEGNGVEIWRSGLCDDWINFRDRLERNKNAHRLGIRYQACRYLGGLLCCNCWTSRNGRELLLGSGRLVLGLYPSEERGDNRGSTVMKFFHAFVANVRETGSLGHVSLVLVYPRIENEIRARPAMRL